MLFKNREEGVCRMMGYHENERYGNRKYNIVMKTPIGLRYGTMDACLADGRMTGTINLLGHSEPFDGMIGCDGNCKISGRLITLMRTIPYTAVGNVSRETIELLLEGERNRFKITGSAVPESEVEEK